jgi:hypothetical protein
MVLRIPLLRDHGAVIVAKQSAAGEALTQRGRPRRRGSRWTKRRGRCLFWLKDDRETIGAADVVHAGTVCNSAGGIIMQDAAGRDRPSSASPPFTRDGYRQLIGRFLDSRYRPATFADVRPQSRDLVVRHDIDLSLEAAVTIAELERELGIRATYFVMVSNSYYNIYSSEGRRLLTYLSQLQHHIGLHFDPVAYPPDLSLADYCRAVDHEMRLLAGIVAEPIEIISFHNPRRDLVNRERPPGSPPHTYEPRFFKEIAYIPDSGGQWRFGGPFEHAAFANGTAIHLLTHPIWWDHAQPTASPAATLEKFAGTGQQQLEQKLSRDFKAYREKLQRGDGE